MRGDSTWLALEWQEASLPVVRVLPEVGTRRERVLRAGPGRVGT